MGEAMNLLSLADPTSMPAEDRAGRILRCSLFGTNLIPTYTIEFEGNTIGSRNSDSAGLMLKYVEAAIVEESPFVTGPDADESASTTAAGGTGTKAEQPKKSPKKPPKVSRRRG